MRLTRTLALAVVTVLLLPAGAALAEYRPENDVVISAGIGKDAANLHALGIVGGLTLAIQESAHQTLKGITGVEFDHSYVWIEVNGTKVLAVDPPAAMYSDPD